jgi:hypothetical protein
MRKFYKHTGTVEEWNAAYYRLEDYLRAHHLTNMVHQGQLILSLLERAAARHALQPDQSPTKLALEEAYDVIDGWFARLLPGEPPARAPMVGRVGLLLVDAAHQWPNVFLAEERDMPPAFKQALRDVTVQSGPDLRLSSMVPRPLDAGDEEEVIETWERIGRLSTAALVGTFAVVAGTLVYWWIQ